MKKPLDEDTSWELFCKKAFQQENCPYPQLEKVGKEIARLCSGLPLSTVVIGGLLLNSTRSLQFWENVVRNIKSSPIAKEKEESLDILSLSYNHLPPHLKPCFLYMGAFKEDSEIRVSKIIKLWIAEGFVRPKGAQILEEVAEGYLKELIDRNLLSIRNHRHNGKIRSCGVHDLVRDLCLKVVSKLPSSVSNMWNMQSLIVILYRSARVVVAPIEIWKMRQLRHVKCSQIYVPDPPPRSNGLLMMDNLQTLTRAVNLRLSEKVCKIIPNIKKLHIDYDTSLKGYDDSLIECLCNLDCLHKLESLKLSIKVGRWPTQDQELHKMMRFPVSLNKLSLRSCARPQLNKIL
ncbi:putative late blight resistance protein homolog R1C-3 [Salvia miltiorrhiza]|uniref:putative late blight resistance protein homolog R1C-3 n=1 Tax=Salvia miltiorrhiza TaxID=226208 RepID=UPI0025AD549B|nr:putative late blight resistance protein homolog R1C-3 [Salvia miltiorrhiza]